MKTVALWSLIVMNAALLVVFASRMTKSNTAQAQAAAGRPGDYLMIPGQVIGGVNDVVFVVDQSSHKLAAISYDDSSKQVLTFAPRDMDRDFDARPVRGGH
jgi:hypothetical protein